MKRQNKNRLSPFRVRMSYETTKPGFGVLCFIFCCSTFVLIGECVVLLCSV